MDLMLETCDCPLCGSAEADPLLGDVRDYEYRTVSNAFSYVRCRSCDLIYLSPRPRAEDLGKTYPADYEQYADGVGEPSLKRAVQAVRRRMVVLPRMKRVLAAVRNAGPIRVLDIGCGNGLNLMAIGGILPDCELHGVDIGDRQAAHLERHGIHFHSGSIESLDLAAGQFDLVILNHVIEHFLDPVAVMRKVASLLAPNGVLYLETHVAGCIEERWFGRYWIGFDAPRHLTVFSPQTLRKLAETAGLRVTQMDNRILSVGDVIYSTQRRIAASGRHGVLRFVISDRNPVLVGMSLAVNVVRRAFAGTSVVRLVSQKMGPVTAGGT